MAFLNSRMLDNHWEQTAPPKGFQKAKILLKGKVAPEIVIKHSQPVI